MLIPLLGLALLLAALGGAAVVAGWLIALCLDERDARRAAYPTVSDAVTVGR